MDDRTLKVLEYDKIIAMLVKLTSSQLGKELAGSLEPETDLSKVDSLLKETSDGVNLIMRKGSPPLGGIHDIRNSLNRVKLGAILMPVELLHIADSLRTVRNLKNYAIEKAVESENNSVSELISLLQSHRKIEEKIAHTILSEDEIADDASITLLNIRRQIKQAQESIKNRLNDIIRSSKYQKYIQDSLVTIRADRYVIPVKQEYRSEIPGLVHDSSASGATIFIEPMSVVEANNNIKQLKIKEKTEIERILRELTAEVESIVVQLESNISILARLDFIFAKAKLSVKYNCVCPNIESNGKIVIKKARHPLLDQSKVVPIDFWLGDQFRTLVITGPNTGGKTVTLKTVGLFILMAQAGLHLPASEGTSISVFKQIFADIGDEQSIEQSLSTFSSHMTNIVKILKKADNNSLVLMDELGAGTDPTEGAALAMSILESLHRKGSITVATTHYSELKTYAISTKGVENASCEFDVKTLRPTYRLLIGVPGKSNAFAISKRLGLPSDILERAKEFLTQEEIKFEDILLSIERNKSESERERIKAESYRLEAEKLKEELERHREKIKAQKEKILKEAREEAKRILLSTKEESETIIEQLKKLEKEREAAERNKAAEEMKRRLRKNIDKIEESLSESVFKREGYVKPPENLNPGDSVFIINLNQKGTVLEPPNKDGEAVIQVGILKINVHKTNLKLLDEQKQEVEKIGYSKINMSKASSISTEIDLRGANLDEAIISVDKFLDDASIAGLGEVTIIHGKGTGILRAGIHKYLRTHPHVRKFRLGKYGEGESGVTVVELK